MVEAQKEAISEQQKQIELQEGLLATKQEQIEQLKENNKTYKKTSGASLLALLLILIL